LIQPPQKQIVYVEAPLAVPRIVERVVEKYVPQPMMMQVVGESVIDDKLMYQTLNQQVFPIPITPANMKVSMPSSCRHCASESDPRANPQAPPQGYMPMGMPQGYGPGFPGSLNPTISQLQQ
jgi:hypothetical protein